MRKHELRIGLRVRVKKGTKDPDFPEYSMAGATGVVKDFDPQESSVGVALDQNYLDSMSSELVALCEEKGLCMAVCQFTTRQLEVIHDEKAPAPADSGDGSGG